MKRTLMLVLLGLAAVGQSSAKKEKYVPNATVTPEVVQQAAAVVPTLRGMMRDPDSFVLESVYLRESTDKYAKDANSQPPAFCYFFRAHNAMGGYGDEGEAMLDSKGKLEILDAHDPHASSLYISMMTCIPKRRLADITAEVLGSLDPTVIHSRDIKGPADRPKIIAAENAGFKKEGVAGYAEIVGDVYVVHSERCSPIRFRANMVQNQEWKDALKRAGIKSFVYTDDAGKRFTYDLTTEQEGGAQ